MIDAIAVQWPAIAVASAVAVLVAIIGGMLTEIGPWYNSLRFPAWKPPNWVFGPVWTTIFTLCVVSAVIAWAGASPSQRLWLVALFALNAGFNILWNILFFKLRRPDWALIETAGLWLSVAALMVFIWPISAIASLLLAPYLTWVTIAGCLNFAIVRRNAPFVGVAARGSI
ncbi:MAG: TspO/MBR family protein [Bosea sp. (in: a-proteobacteria)]